MKFEIVDKLVNTHRTVDVRLNDLFLIQTMGDSTGNFWAKILKNIVKVSQASNTDRKIEICVGASTKTVEAPELNLEKDSSSELFSKFEIFIKEIVDWRNEVNSFPQNYTFFVSD